MENLFNMTSLYEAKECSNRIKVEFKYDERTATQPILLPQAEAVPILEKNFNMLDSGDRVWLNGIISLNNNNNAFTPATLFITRTSPIVGSGSVLQVIYTQLFSVDSEGDDDQVQIPFSFVDVLPSQLVTVRYRVLIVANTPNLTLDGTNTLTAIRFTN